MMTCVHGRQVAPGKPYTLDQCRACWVAGGGNVNAVVKPAKASSVDPNGLLAAPPVRTGPCTHLGDQLTGHDKLRFSLNVAKEWHVCDHPERPLGEHVCSCAGCGPQCRGYLALDGPAIHNITGLFADRHVTNCSIIPWRGKRLLAYRIGWRSSNVRLCELDDRYRVVAGSDRFLPLAHPHAAGGQEDPRLFVFAGKLHVAFVGVRRTSLTDETAIPRQLFARLDDDYRVEEVFEPEYMHGRRIEKNWQPFEWDGKLCAVYSMVPWRVLRIYQGAAGEWIATPFTDVDLHHPDVIWDFGDCRGGAPPVAHNGKFYSFFHGTDKRDYHDGRPALYAMGVCEFEGQPPFRPLRMTHEPLLSPDLADVPKGPHGGKTWYAATVYAAGCYADVERQRWVTSYGYHDHFSRVAEFSFEQVESALSAI